MEDILEIVLPLLIGGGTLVLLAISPPGRALAERIRGKAAPPPSAEDSVREEVASLRRELTELEARIDFAERLIGEPPTAKRLPPPQESGAVEE